MNKTFWIPLIASLGTIITLYLIGYIFNIDSLVFDLSLPNSEISLIPVIVGVIVGFISERIVKSKHH